MIIVETMINTGEDREEETAAYIGLGSNMRNRADNLAGAIARIEKLGITIARASSLYETEPVDFKDQARFLNQVIETRFPWGWTAQRRPILADREPAATIKAAVLLSELLEIEREMGRRRETVNGPRVIDIDLLLFGDLIVSHSKWDDETNWSVIDKVDIFLPHPRMHKRRFVMEPLCEIAPEVIHPVLNQTVREILASLDDSSTVRLYHPAAAGS